MKTEELIDLLSRNLEPAENRQVEKTLAIALVVGGLAAFCLMLATVGLRSDLHIGYLAIRLVFALSLVGAGAAVLGRLMRPGMDRRRLSWLIAAPFVVIAIAGLSALLLVSTSTLGSVVLGTAWASCIVCIPLFSIAPFAALVWALRGAAPTNLRRAGAVAGLVAGALGAAAYALYCPDDSLPFIAIWYSVPIALLSLAGAALGSRLLRW